MNTFKLRFFLAKAARLKASVLERHYSPCGTPLARYDGYLEAWLLKRIGEPGRTRPEASGLQPAATRAFLDRSTQR